MLRQEPEGVPSLRQPRAKENQYLFYDALYALRRDSLSFFDEPG
jgi:hypothetical protein